MSIADVTDRAIQDLISLQARRAVVTGGAKGLGRAIARRLAEAGAAVLIGDIDEEGAKSAAEERTARFGVAAVASRLDVADPGSISATADTAVAELGGIDIWVNNAGGYPWTPVLQPSGSDWGPVMRLK